MGKTVARNPGEGTAYWMLGGLYELKAGSDETDGQATIFEFTIPEGAGPPPHTHPGGESVYVLEGTIRYHIGSPQIGAFLVSVGRGGAAGNGSLDDPRGHGPLPPPMTEEPDIERLMAIAEKHGMKMKPPEGAPA